ncbi:uncharacterized protein LOC113216159 [Frankliniella occidentalis]|uniref:Uncharacterized protein LOC113216159 n=1 Tax=Frankliniella occidentalis TaxID=133901 RepID=A0A9C6X644_FRAOC|nr:uncharacterized protein LOC113216159 [Frankliniella occidentalis]
MSETSTKLVCFHAPRGPCAVCGLEGSPCGDCQLDYYCGEEHRAEDLARHQAGCRVLELRTDGRLGRHVVATRDIPAATVILRELPALAIPPPWTKEEQLNTRLEVFQQAYCVGCLADRDITYNRQCASCGWPVCRSACSKSEAHRAECEAFQRAGFKLNTESRNKAGRILWMALAALRSHLAMEKKPSLRLQDLQATHTQPLPADGVQPPVLGVNDYVSWRAEEAVSVKMKKDWPAAARWLRETAGLSWLTEEELVRAAGVNDINGINLNPLNCDDDLNGKIATYLFPAVSMVEHDCDPTGMLLARDPHSQTMEHIVVTTRDVSQGEHISLDYLDSPYQDGVTRRSLLCRGWNIDCHCRLCEDPTSAGLFLGSPCCPDCKERGVKRLMVVETLSNENSKAKYRCQDCTQSDNVPSTTLAERFLLLQKSTISGFGEFEPLIKRVIFPKGPLHRDHRLILSAEFAASLFIRIQVIMKSIPEGSIDVYLDKVQRLLDALDLVKTGLNHHRWALLQIQNELVFDSLENGVPTANDKRLVLKKRLLQLKENLENLAPYYFSAEEKNHFESTFNRPGQMFLKFLDKI